MARLLFVPEQFVASAARTASGVSDSRNVKQAEQLMFCLIISEITGTGAFVGFYAQQSWDQTVWHTTDEWVRALAAGALMVSARCIAPYARLGWTIGGTSPSVTFYARIGWRE
jgi:hypothetical protein